MLILKFLNLKIQKAAMSSFLKLRQNCKYIEWAESTKAYTGSVPLKYRKNHPEIGISF